MNVIHICSDFAKQSIYDQLVTSLDEIGLSRQFVYVPVRSEAELSAPRNEALDKTRFRFAKVLKPHHRVFFRRKIKTVYADLFRSVDVEDYSLVHAHFLYSDGAVALRLKRASGIPYIVAVRNTDINVFMKYRPDLRGLCFEILRHASAVIFISPGYRDQLERIVPISVWKDIQPILQVVPNGISDFWLREPPARSKPEDSVIRLLYVGDFSRNKNLPNTIRATNVLREERDVQLTLVGGGQDGAAEVREMLDSGRYPWVDYRGRIDDKKALADMYRAHDIFVMPSLSETFGVAYIEALSQGMPIVHSIGQGVDGYFQAGTVAEAVDPSQPRDIADKIGRIADRLDDVRVVCTTEAKRFDWTRIAAEYMRIYEEVV